MRPVVGIDVAKGRSVGFVFLDKNKPFKKAFQIEHTLAGFEEFGRLLREVKDASGVQSDIILEATGHYHLPLIDFFGGAGVFPDYSESACSSKSKESTIKESKD